MDATYQPAAAKDEFAGHSIDTLSNGRVVSLFNFEDMLQSSDETRTLGEIDAEIAALEAKYGTTPNAETAAAIEEGRARRGKRASSIEEFFEILHNADNSGA